MRHDGKFQTIGVVGQSWECDARNLGTKPQKGLVRARVSFSLRFVSLLQQGCKLSHVGTRFLLLS